MNKSALKNYAARARREFITAIKNRAYVFGLEAGEPLIRDAGLEVIIKNQPYPKKIGGQVEKLAAKIKAEGFEKVVADIAYTWFNRFVALRYMELHNFLPHGLRVLSNPDNINTPEILQKILDVELPTLKREEVLELKSKNADSELYRKILVAQCNALNPSLPFLFEHINDETELLLPDNLLRSDSLIRKLVENIDETDWQEVEIIGWLYQFYISERKDEVIGKTVKSEDIPAATQLFTPNWIVKYMTQNSLGRLWLENNLNSQLADKMEFYIRRSADGSSASENREDVPRQIGFYADGEDTARADEPSALRLLDPACGSGHILVEAYDLLKEIYLERGYRLRDIPLLILENNLFGLDIDERAVQLASFALLMKARNDDRKIFEKLNDKQIHNPESSIPNIHIVPDSSELEHTPPQIAEMFFSDKANPGAIPIRDNSFLFGEMENQPSLMQRSEIEGQRSKVKDQITEQNIIDLLELFENGKTFGSLIRIPHGFEAVIEEIARVATNKLDSGNFLEQIAAKQTIPFIQAAQILARKYDAVIANPPYMGGKGINAALKEFAKREFPDSKSDLFAMFIERNLEMTKESGKLGFMSPFVWMFISSYEKLRDILINDATITTLVQLEYSGFAEATVPICTFTLAKKHTPNAVGSFIRLSDFKGHKNQEPKTLEAIQNPDCGWFYNSKPDEFKKIPGSPIAYWLTNKIIQHFGKHKKLGDIMPVRGGMTTADNEKFVRLWHEISFNKVNKKYWIPYNKGGEYRKWYGNQNWVVNWANNGEAIKSTGKASVRSEELYLKSMIGWTDVTSFSQLGVRYYQDGFIFDASGPSLFPKDANEAYSTLGFLTSKLTSLITNALNPTLHVQAGNIASLPFNTDVNNSKIPEIAKELIEIARADWDSFETSWDFSRLPILDFGFWNEEKGKTPESVEEAFRFWEELTEERIRRMQELETENNRLFIEAYGLEDELEPEVPREQITLARADRVGDTKLLLSYFVGCAMGRYSLDAPGLIYADAGNIGFDHSRYKTFAADEDGIIPITDEEWFPQEAANRFADFIRAAFEEGVRVKGLGIREEREKQEGIREGEALTPNPSSLTPNLQWIAEGLGKKAGETPLEAIRRYFSRDFFKDHLKTYKKRPIYWLFSSGKLKAFECLVYLHRHNELTLARMRTDYVTPLFGKLAARNESLQEQIASGTPSAAQIKSAEKEIDMFKKKYAELQKFDDELHNLAEKRISIDLDDGVKVNYGKFGNLLAEKKQIAK